MHLVSLFTAGVTTAFFSLASVAESNSRIYPVVSHYDNPIVLKRADPWLHREDNNGCYYFTGTVPEFDRIELRYACTINGLKEAAPVTIWRKKNHGPMSSNIWAPELHRIDSTWYIYFAASEIAEPFKIRIYVLSNTNEDPRQGAWREEGQLHTGWDTFSLDATTFEHAGKRYLIWAQQNAAQTYNSALWLAEMRSPTEIRPPIVKLSEPSLPWEIQGYKVNEGPAVIKKGNRLFVFYSASATDHQYAMGLLHVDTRNDILDAENWHKSQDPILTTDENLSRYGPGHNSFVMNEDNSQLLMVYHSRTYRDLQGNPLTDPNRHARVREISWTADGWPLLFPSIGD